jgi:hypothetical protein
MPVKSYPPARLRGQALTVSDFSARLVEAQAPVKLVGELQMPLVPNGLPVDGHLFGTFEFPQTPGLVDAELSGRRTADNCWSPAW